MTAQSVSDFFLVFCMNAATTSDSRLDVEGIYNELYAPGFPAKQDALVMAGAIEWHRETKGAQKFTIHLVDPGDKPIFTIEGQTEVDARIEGRAPAKTHLIFPLENLVFVKPGRYRVVVALKDGELKGQSLYLLHSATEDEHLKFGSDDK